MPNISQIKDNINNILQNSSLSTKEKQTLLNNILSDSSLNRLKKLCTKEHLKINGCTSSNIKKLENEEQKKAISDIILKSLLSSVSENKPEPEKKSVTKADRIKQLKQKLKQLQVSAGLTGKSEEELTDFLNTIGPDGSENRCMKEDDYEGCKENETCFIKNQMCMDNSFKHGKLERRPIQKGNKEYLILSTKKEAEQIQKNIDSTKLDIEDLIKKDVDQLLSTTPPEQLSYRSVWIYIQSRYPSEDPTFIRKFVKAYLKRDYETEKPAAQEPEIEVEPEKPAAQKPVISSTRTPMYSENPFIQQNIKFNIQNRLNTFIDEGMADVPGDGDCFFHCIHKLINLTYNIDISTNTCRQHIIDMLEKLIDIDENFKIILTETIKIEDFDSLDDYIEEMRQDGSWAGQAEIVAACSLYNVDIIVKSINDKDYSNVFTNDYNVFKHKDEDTKDLPKCVWYLYHVNTDKKESRGNHYQYNPNVYSQQYQISSKYQLGISNFIPYTINSTTDYNSLFKTLLNNKNITYYTEPSPIPEPEPSPIPEPEPSPIPEPEPEPEPKPKPEPEPEPEPEQEDDDDDDDDDDPGPALQIKDSIDSDNEIDDINLDDNIKRLLNKEPKEKKTQKKKHMNVDSNVLNIMSQFV